MVCKCFEKDKKKVTLQTLLVLLILLSQPSQYQDGN